MKHKKNIRSLHRNVLLMLWAMLVFIPGVMAEWPNYRGGQELQGVATGRIPDKLGMKWSFATGSEIKSAPVVSGNRIVTGSTDNYLYCLSLQGRLLWKLKLDNAIEAPALILNNTVYVGDLSGYLYAIDLENGKQLWRYETGNQIMGAPNWWSDGQKTYILTGSYDYYLHCVDATSGKGIWKYEAQNYLNAAVAIEGNHAVFGGCDGLLHVVDLRTGKAESTIEIATYVAGAVALDQGIAYTGDYDGMFSSVDYRNKRIKWKFESRDRQLPFIGSPSILGNRVIIGSRDRYVYCLDKRDGSLIWQRNTGSRVDASPLADSQNVLVANMRGDLLLLSQENGNLIWTFELGSPVIGSPAFSNGMIITGSQDGNIYGLGRP